MIPDEFTQVAVFNAAQLRKAGVSPTDLRRALAAGAASRVKRGWFTVRDLSDPLVRHRVRVEVELREHPGTVASHHSGAARLGLPLHRPNWSDVHLMRTSPGPAQRRGHLLIHRQVDGCTGASPALVVAQTALHCPVSGLMSIDHALRREWVTVTKVAAWSKALQHFPGHGHLDLITRLADGRRESPLESRTAYMFDLWGWTLQPQFPVPGSRYRADGWIVGTRVLVESDGMGKYDRPGTLQAEKVRQDEVRLLGWGMVRVTSALLDQPAKLHAQVLRELAEWG